MGVLCLLEATVLSRDDYRKPNDITMFTFKHGKPFCRDCTCANTIASTQIHRNSVTPGQALNTAETLKRTRYRALADCYQFEAVTN